MDEYSPYGIHIDTPVPWQIMLHWARVGSTPTSWQVLRATQSARFPNHPQWWLGTILGVLLLVIVSEDVTLLGSWLPTGWFILLIFFWCIGLIGIFALAVWEQPKQQQWIRQHVPSAQALQYLLSINLTFVVVFLASCIALGLLAAWLQVDTLTLIATLLALALFLTILILGGAWLVSRSSERGAPDILIVTPTGIVESAGIFEPGPTIVSFAEIQDMSVSVAQEHITFVKHDVARVWHPRTTYTSSPIVLVAQAYAHYRLIQLLDRKIHDLEDPSISDR